MARALEPARAQVLAEPVLSEDPAEAGRDGRGVERIDEHRGIADDLRNGGNIGGHDRGAAGHRLQRGEPETLVERGEHEGPGTPVEGEQLLRRGVGLPVHPGLEAERGDALPEGPDVPGPSPSPQDQADRKLPGHQGEGLHEADEVLVWHHVADVE